MDTIVEYFKKIIKWVDILFSTTPTILDPSHRKMNKKEKGREGKKRQKTLIRGERVS